MKSDGPVTNARVDVAVVGGGFSGTMAAAQLSARGLSVALVEGGGREGRGIAYSTREAVHLLNVPAAKMSAWPSAPDDFVAAGHDAAAFVPRRAFGAYLGAILDAALADGVRLVTAPAVAAVRDGEGWHLALGDGQSVAARALVLAQGNQPPEPMRVGAGVDPALFINNPWGDDARAAVARLVARGGDALILGTGLTMVDMVLSLDAAGHQGRIVALSRRGQIPRAHAPHDPMAVAFDAVPQGNVLALSRWLRGRGGNWRGAVDALRPHAQALWRGLDAAEQGRFLRHARPYWDVHRHRIAPQVAGQLKDLIAAGRLAVVAGRISALRGEGDGVVVEYRRRGVDAVRHDGFGAVFNCTGPLGAMGRTRDPLLRQLIGDGLVAVDRLGIGLKVDAAARAGERAWALGPLTKGEFWEIVAVPDIRGQVAAVADDIARELEHGQS
jgi:uncharacterized NAD(P)/FAD-binding protein YdhS